MNSMDFTKRTPSYIPANINHWHVGGLHEMTKRFAMIWEHQRVSKEK